MVATEDCQHPVTGLTPSLGSSAADVKRWRATNLRSHDDHETSTLRGVWSSDITCSDEPFGRTILRFWGARPKADPSSPEPYHDLRLHDPIRKRRLIDRFEAWMRSRGSSPQTRNHCRSVLRGLYKTALLPAYRATSGVTVNPFRDIPRETVVERTVTISLADLRGWLTHASYHVRLAVAIASPRAEAPPGDAQLLADRDHLRSSQRLAGGP
jgi:hypothetical protein